MRWIFLDGCRLQHGVQRIELPSGRVSVLAAVLLLNQGHKVPKERLRDILWPEDTCENMRARISTAVWRLRKLIDKVGGQSKIIHADRDFVTYSGTDAECDALELGRVAQAVMRTKGERLEGDLPQRVEACVVQYHADFLPRAEDHWSLITRESLRSSALLLLEALIRHMRAEGRWGRVNELASRLLMVDPSLEWGYRQLIAAHGERNDLGAAERQFQLCSRVLKDTLDVGPAPETAAAIEALKIARANAPAAAGRQRLLKPPSLARVEHALDHLDKAQAALRDG